MKNALLAIIGVAVVVGGIVAFYMYRAPSVVAPAPSPVPEAQAPAPANTAPANSAANDDGLDAALLELDAVVQ